MLPEGRRTKDLGCLCGMVTAQVTSSLTCNTKCMLQIYCCQPLCFVSSTEPQPPLTSSFPPFRPCPAHEAPAQLLCSFPHPEGGQARGGDNLQQRLRLQKKEVSAQSGQLSQPTAAVIPLPQVPVLFCSCFECCCTSSNLVPIVLSACSIQTGRWGKGVKRKQLIMRVSQNCFQILLLQCVLGV